LLLDCCITGCSIVIGEPTNDEEFCSYCDDVHMPGIAIFIFMFIFMLLLDEVVSA